MKAERGKIGAYFMQSASAYVANTCIYMALTSVQESYLYKMSVKPATDRALKEYKKCDIAVAQLLGAMFKDIEFGPQINLHFGEALEHNRARLYDAVVKECAGEPFANIWAELVVAETFSEISVYLGGNGTAWEDQRKRMQNTLQAVINATHCPRSLFKDLTVRSIGDQIARHFLSEDWVVKIINEATREYVEQKKD